MTDLTPNDEAVEAATRNALLRYDFWQKDERYERKLVALREEALSDLTAAMPALTAQIRAATVWELRAERERALTAREAADNDSDRAWQNRRAYSMGRAADYLERTALLPAPENAEKEDGDD